MARILFSNDATTSVAGAITNTATAVNVAAGTGVEFPVPTGGNYFIASFYDAATGTITEIVHVTAVSGDTFTIVRAQEGTTARAWNSGDFFSNLHTAGAMQNMLQQGDVNTILSIIYFGIDTSTTANTVTVTFTTPAMTAQSVEGQHFSIRIANTNTGPGSISLGGYASLPIQRGDGTALHPGDMIAGEELQLVGSGSALQINNLTQNVLQNASAVGSVFYVNANTGNDSNTGLTSGTAFRTLQGAETALSSNYFATGPVTLMVAVGSYATVKFQFASIPSWVIIGSGSGTNPSSNTVITGTTGQSGIVASGISVDVQSCHITSAAGQPLVYASYGGQVTMENCSYTGTSSSTGLVSQSGSLTVSGAMTFSGSFASIFAAQFNGLTTITNGTNTANITFSGCTASVGVASAIKNSCINAYSSQITFSGTVTGPSYLATGFSVIDTNSSGVANYFPATAAGVATPNGAYYS